MMQMIQKTDINLSRQAVVCEDHLTTQDICCMNFEYVESIQNTHS